MARPVVVVELTDEEREELERRVRSALTAQRDVLRARIVLLRAQGPVGGSDRRDRPGQHQHGIFCGRDVLNPVGLAALNDAPGRGRKPWLPEGKVQQVIERVTQPPAGCQQWSTRSMADAVGISHQSVHAIWKKNDLKPHQTRTFKISRDQHFEEKFWDVIGLYLDPPDKALVLCCDEKSQCQALERTQPGLPLGMGHIRTRTHDYKRHGTITLFAALNYLDGKLISRTESRHTHVEWLRFLRQIDRQTPRGRTIHVIADNYATHKHERVKAWLAKHPRFQMHFTPTSSFLAQSRRTLLW